MKDQDSDMNFGIQKIRELYNFMESIKDSGTSSKEIQKALTQIQNIEKDLQKIISEKENNEAALREKNDSFKDINDYLKTVTDQLEAARKAALESSKAKSVFLNNISHEMRTPLNAIIGYSRQLRDTSEEKKRLEFIDIIERNGEALLLLINDIIDISRLEVDKVELKYKSIKLSKFIEQLAWVFKVRADEKNISFIADIHEDLPEYVEIDQVRLRQILYNILGNAVKFTEEGYVSFFINGEKDEDDKNCIKLIFEIEDTGIGINKEDLERIFQPFEQQKDQDVNFGGVGLGLTIAKKLIELMDGEIEIVEKKEKGSIFKITLSKIKIGSPPKETKEFIEASKVPIDFKKAKILLVDDDKINKRLMREYLELLNVEILEASNGKECLDILENEIPDIIIMDIRMPVMNGIVATKKIKANKKTSHIPVIILSATAVLDEEDIKEDEYECVISKPVHMFELVTEIKKHLKLKKS